MLRKDAPQELADEHLVYDCNLHVLQQYFRAAQDIRAYSCTHQWFYEAQGRLSMPDLWTMSVPVGDTWPEPSRLREIIRDVKRFRVGPGDIAQPYRSLSDIDVVNLLLLTPLLRT